MEPAWAAAYTRNRIAMQASLPIKQIILMKTFKLNSTGADTRRIHLGRSKFKKSILPAFKFYTIPLFLAFGLSNISCKKLEAKVGGDSSINVSAKSQFTTSSTSGDEFTIAVMGDTQNYVDYGNDPADSDCQDMGPFTAMMNWIIANKTAENIKYVVSLGDITDQYGATDTGAEGQWIRAHDTYEALKVAGIPFGVVPGNHDMNFASGGNYPNNGTTFPVNPFFNQYFGRSQFPSYNVAGFPTSASNENHYDVVNTPAGDLMILYLRWHHMESEAQAAYTWAYDMMNNPVNADKKVIVVTHFAVASSDDNLDGKKDWGEQCYQTPCYSQASGIYDKLKSLPNFFMFLGGHSTREVDRLDTYNGRTVKSFTTDFSASCTPGSASYYPPGVIRTMKFSASKDVIEFKSFLPGQTPINQFNRPWYRGFGTTRTSDFDNNGMSQPAFFNAGTWTIQNMANVTYGVTTGDVPVPGDYDADGKTDIAIFRPSTGGYWHIQGVSGQVQHGTAAGDIPTPGDFDGNGSTDFAIYRPSSKTFYVYQSYLSSNLSQVVGSSGDIPVPADYNGDGKVDYATFSPSTAVWTIPGISTSQFGVNGDIPVPGDYNGTGQNTRAVYRRSNNGWYVYGSAGNPVTIGQTGDIPVPGDYNGDGKTDMAVYRPSTGSVIINGQTTIATGALNKKPVNLPYHIRKFFFP